MGGFEWNENSLISASYPTGDYARQQINGLEILFCFEKTLHSWRSVLWPVFCLIIKDAFSILVLESEDKVSHFPMDQILAIGRYA